MNKIKKTRAIQRIHVFIIRKTTNEVPKIRSQVSGLRYLDNRDSTDTIEAMLCTKETRI